MVTSSGWPFHNWGCRDRIARALVYLVKPHHNMNNSSTSTNNNTFISLSKFIHLHQQLPLTFLGKITIRVVIDLRVAPSCQGSCQTGDSESPADHQTQLPSRLPLIRVIPMVWSAVLFGEQETARQPQMTHQTKAVKAVSAQQTGASESTIKVDDCNKWTLTVEKTN